MTKQGLQAARTLVEDALVLAHSLSNEEWAMPSAASGWTVQDVYTHMAFFFNTIADPKVNTPHNPSGKAEVLNDLSVQERADLPPERTLGYYTTQARAALVALEALQAPEMAKATLRLADLGTYHLSMLADAVAFDHLVHLNSDILSPHGPISRPSMVMDEERLTPTLNWMLTGLPQMCGEALKPVLESSLGIVLTGPGARSVTLWQDADQIQIQDVAEAADLPQDQAESTTEAFLRWGTQRDSWQHSVTVRGDRQAVTNILDAIDII